MNPIKIIFPGKYVDSQVHKDRLFVWTNLGTVWNLSLPRLVKSFATETTERVLTNAFLQSGSLYPRFAWELTHDRDVRAFLRAKFEAAAANDYVLDQRRLSASFLALQLSPTPFPHADSNIHGANLYTVGTQGFHRTSVSTRANCALSFHVKKLWDGQATVMDAAWGSAALAAGNDGLWELPDLRETAEPTQVSPEHASSCGFAFQSISATSPKGGYFAEYTMLDSPPEDPRKQRERRFSRIVPAKGIFRNANVTSFWAVREKLCALTPSNILVKRYVPWSKSARIATLGTIPIHTTGTIVSARTAVFGTVLELDNSLIILNSDGTRYLINERPLFWRIFPRSPDHANQLHVGFPDRLEIYSFNHDGFVPQHNKVNGAQYGRITPDALPTKRSAITSPSASNDNATECPDGDSAADANHGRNK